MNLLTAYKRGFSQTLPLQRMVAAIYAIHLLFALAIAIQAASVMQALIGDSLEIDKLLSGYDHTVISDLRHVHGEALGVVTAQIKWVLLLYLLALVGIRGGMIALLRDTPPGTRSLRSFWAGSYRHYFPFLRLGILMLGLQLLTAVAVFVPFGWIVSKSIGPGFTERGVILSALPVLLLFLALLSFLMTVSQYAHARLSRPGKPRIGHSMWAAFQMVLRHPGKTWGLFLFNVGTLLPLSLLYLLLSHAVGMSGSFTIALGFLIQQAFVYARILAKVINWASALHMEAHLNPEEAWPEFAEASA